MRAMHGNKLAMNGLKNEQTKITKQRNLNIKLNIIGNNSNVVKYLNLNCEH